MSDILGSPELPINRANSCYQIGHTYYFYSENQAAVNALNGGVYQDDFNSGGVAHPHRLINLKNQTQTTWVEWGLPGSGAANELGSGWEEYFPPDGAKAPNAKPKALIGLLCIEISNSGGTASSKVVNLAAKTYCLGTLAGAAWQTWCFRDIRYWDATVNSMWTTYARCQIPIDESGKFQLNWTCQLNVIDRFDLYLQGFIL